MTPELDHASPSGWPMLINVIDRPDNRRRRREDQGGSEDCGRGRRQAATATVGSVGGARSTKRERRPSARKRAAPPRLDQFYTKYDVAALYLTVLDQHLDTASSLMVEPSAGGGAFSRQMRTASVALDIEPRHPGIFKANFLKFELRSARRIITVGNPPFGKNASLAVAFFNHAAKWSDAIAMIFPRSFL